MSDIKSRARALAVLGVGGLLAAALAGAGPTATAAPPARTPLVAPAAGGEQAADVEVLAALTSGRSAVVPAPGAATVTPVLRDSRPNPGVVPLPRLGPERVPDPAGLARGKAEAAAYAAAQVPQLDRPGAVAAAPVAVRSWNGLSNPDSQPSDSTSAVSPSALLEMVNSRFAVYSRTSSTPLQSGSLLDLTGCASASCVDSVFDPQVFWDGQTKRFYYAADSVVDDGVNPVQNFLQFGFSRTATPGSNINTDWCRYNVGYGSEFPDYPKLGDSSAFALIGVNVFSAAGPFRGSDVVGISKPAASTTCPAASTFAFGIGQNLKMQGGSASAFTPVPADQTDPDATGWAVARPVSVPSAGATALGLFKITKAVSGAPVFQTTGTNVTVPAFKIPADVPQPGSADKLDSSDTRPTQAVSAVDPLHGGKVGLWTSHTVLGGAGAQVRWYEIDPAAHGLLQSGTVTSSSQYVFNGAVSPDRVVNGSTRKFGGNMLITYDQGSAASRVAVMVAGKRGAGALSAPAQLKLSSAIDRGFGTGCSSSGHVCRWGDYAAATPDPAASTTGASGAVWVTSMYVRPLDPNGANWGSWNAAYRP